MESARLKLIRAAEGIQVVHDKIAAYSSEHPYEIITESDGTEKLNVFREPPPEISVLGGEVIYQIRSALDHLAFDLIKMNPSGVTLPNRWFDRCEFPLWTRLPANRVPPLLKSDFASVLPGITDEPFALIESLQPYNNRGLCLPPRMFCSLQ